jgi:hypothetical protein
MNRGAPTLSPSLVLSLSAFRQTVPARKTHSLSWKAMASIGGKVTLQRERLLIDYSIRAGSNGGLLPCAGS